MRRSSRTCLPPAAALLCALAGTGCLPEDRSGDVTSYAYVYSPERDEYALEPAVLTNLESFRALRGRDFNFRNGAWLEFTIAEPGLTAHEGGSFALEYSFDEAGVAVPTDLHSLYAVSAYRALEMAADAVRARGVTQLYRLDAYYFPEMTSPLTGDMRLDLTDNAAFISQARGFLFVPSFALADPPLLVNEWVQAHEYGHSVIHRVIFGLENEPDFSDRVDSNYRALHEGVADLIGLGVSGDNDGFRFIRGVKVDRDINEPRDFTLEDKLEMDTSADGFDSHYQGSLLARAIYETWTEKGTNGRMSVLQREAFLQRVLDTLARVEVGADFALADYANLWAEGYPESERAPVCAVFQQRLFHFQDRLTACPLAEVTP